jgi:hypothetical protein
VSITGFTPNASLSSLIQFLTKNSSQSFAIQGCAGRGEMLPQGVIDECLIPAARFLSFYAKRTNDIIIQMDGNTGLAPRLDHRTTYALTKIVFFFRIPSVPLYLPFVRKLVEWRHPDKFRQQQSPVLMNQAQSRRTSPRPVNLYLKN